MSKRKRIAIITTWFPPKNGVAVNRMNAFYEYLSVDYDITVYTHGVRNMENAFLEDVKYFSIPAFFDRIKHKTSDGKLKHHSKSAINLILNKLQISPFTQWGKKVVKELVLDHNENKYDIVLSSFNPIEPHFIAFDFKKKYPKVKWIADMRDGMSNNPNLNHQLKTRYANVERKFNGHIDLLLTVSKPILEDFRQNIPKTSFFLEVRNGFNHAIKPNKIFNDNFTISYSGTVYGLNKPDLFFDVILNLIRKQLLPEDLKVQFIGSSKNFFIPNSIQKNVFFYDRMPQQKAVELVAKSDANLLLLAPVKQKGIFSGKLFDYLSVEKPIIALVDTEDVAADLIRQHNAGFVADFYNKEEIEKAILQAYNLWKNKETLNIDHEKTKSLHRKIQVEKLGQFIHKMLEE